MIYPTAAELKYFDVDDFAKVLMTMIDDMTKNEQETIMQALSHCRVKEDYWFLYQYLDKPHVWKMPMVSIDTFICDDHFLGTMTKQGNGVYPLLRKAARDIMRGGYNEVSAVCGLGSGKSFLSSLIATYMGHHLLCLRSPHLFYKLVKDKPIGIMNMGLTATQALKVVFESIKTFISNSDFFTQLNPKIGNSGVIKFENEGIEIISGNSKVTTQLGFNLFCGILDEAAFYYEEAKSDGNSANNEKTNVAQGLYEGLRGRISSRFGDNGLIMMISSPRTVSDYIMTKLEDSKELGADGKRKFRRIYGIQFPTWKVKDPSVYAGSGTFLFNTKDNSIFEEPLSVVEKSHPVNKLSDKVFDYTKYVWEIPDTFKSEFIKNPNKSKRDIGAFPSEAIEGFLNAERVSTIFNMKREDPVRGEGKYEFMERPLRTNYFIHIDIGLNKNGTGDFTGFVMGHAGGWEIDEATKERRLQIHIDLIERIGVKKGEQEVSIADIRERIYILKEMGFKISLVTLDGFQSKEMFQILQKRGVRAEYLSVDRTIDPYNMLRESINEKRIDMYYNEHLYKELIQLEEVTIGSHTKVDHPKTGCFTGDTRVALANGTCPTFEELTKMEGPFYVYSIGKNGIEIVEAIKPRITKQTTELVEVLLDNYQVIRCTPEHRFMTLDREWVEAQNLTSDISIMSLPSNANHRVISVKKVTLMDEVPVYDISVPGNENFALASGVFVHNSKDIADALAGCVHGIMMNTSYSMMNMANAPTEQSVEPNVRDYIIEKQKNKDMEIRRRMAERQQSIEDKIFARQG